MNLEFTSVSTPISRDNLPVGLWFEQDGSCWRAVECEPHPITGLDWRWGPANMKAFAKEGPQGEMTDHVPITNLNRT